MKVGCCRPSELLACLLASGKISSNRLYKGELNISPSSTVYDLIHFSSSVVKTDWMIILKCVIQFYPNSIELLTTEKRISKIPKSVFQEISKEKKYIVTKKNGLKPFI